MEVGPPNTCKALVVPEITFRPRISLSVKAPPHPEWEPGQGTDRGSIRDNSLERAMDGPDRGWPKGTACGTACQEQSGRWSVNREGLAGFCCQGSPPGLRDALPGWLTPQTERVQTTPSSRQSPSTRDLLQMPTSVAEIPETKT